MIIDEGVRFNELSLEEIGRAVIQNIPHSLLVIQATGRILFANQNSAKVLGYSPEQLEGKSFSILFTPEDMDFFYPNLLFLAKNNKGFEGELMLLKRNQTRFFAYMYMIPLSNTIEGLAIVCIQDIDTTKRLKQIVTVGNYDDLVKLANGIAHEIRNPLVSIGGFITRIKKVCELSAETYKYYLNVLTNLKRIESIIKKVQTFIMLPKPEFKPSKIPEILASALALYKGVIEDKHIKVVTNLSDTTIFVDRQMMEKVFDVFIENSIEAMGDDGGEISVWDMKSEAYLKVFFKDNGQGISPADLPYIFTPFFSTKAHGTGIDLATAKKIIQAHNGTIAVESDPKKGTLMIITLPIERRRRIRRELLSPEALVPEESISLRNT